jgi:phycocyanobilin:ferredoxin oxidoreductase
MGSLAYTRPDPEKGAPGHPRMQIENRVYSSRTFSKIHLELCRRQDGLQVFHCVMYPRLEYDLPILSFDMVGVEDRVSLAIVDPCPVSWDRRLPDWYADAVRRLQSQYGTQRAAPDWGREIFSDVCVLVRPTGPEDVAAFVTYAAALTRVHLEVARLQQPVGFGRGPRVQEIRAAHLRYVENQLKNDKTRKVLEAAFGEEFAQRYMGELMFPQPPPLP